MRALATLLVLAALPAAAAEPSPSVVRWQGELARVDGLLRAGAWIEARVGSAALVQILLSDLKGGPVGARLLATAYAQRALAEAGVEAREDALWSLRIAACLDPLFAEAPLDPFGDAGRRLDAWRRAEPDLGVDFGADPEKDPRAGALALDTPGLEPPALLEAPTIVFRASAEVLRAFDPELAVELVVGADGLPRAPAVRGSLDNPSPVAASLETLRRWRFEPARLDGRPVPVLLTLDLPLTRGAADRARERLERLRATPDP
ncbi:MAG TPA: hypothetical protein VLF66_07925 [Thermoanaerobaculia bacterium]|nr:hypothetical protein [Thermoanaerobaculia bacterium]